MASPMAGYQCCPTQAQTIVLKAFGGHRPSPPFAFGWQRDEFAAMSEAVVLVHFARGKFAAIPTR